MKKLLTLILAFMATTATLFADSGTCGANVNWDLTGDVLTISGTGYMTSYTSPSKRPWHSFASSITSVVIEEGVMNIGESAFEDFSSLTSVTIPNSLEGIEGYAFFGCSALSSVTIPDNIMTIGNSTFKYCSALTTITIPANVNYIKYQAFSGCTGLTEIICEATTPPTCEDLVFEEVTNTIPVYVPAESVSAYKTADGWNYFTNIQGTKEIYAALSGSTMTIYYDDQKASHSDLLENWTPEEGAYNVPDATLQTITNAVINPSMVDARPTSTYSWFYWMGNLTTIDGLANLYTSEVTNMEGMFEGCSSLSSLDVSNFNTANVTDMRAMFEGCSSLTSLDVSNFNTANVTDMSYMFKGCSSLTSLDLSSFNTANVTSRHCMFEYCESLKTIYCDEDWSTSSASSNYMFHGCTALVGGKGTKYNSGMMSDKTYARPDGLDDQSGYFTAKGAGSNEIYAALSGSTITIYFDDQKASRPGALTDWTPEEGMQNVPDATRETITKAVIDASMVDASPTSTLAWFYSLYNLTTIDGLANLNTSEVTDMTGMFQDCSSLTSLDLSGFNTANVTSMYTMFYGCSSLTSLDVSGFNTAKVEYMNSMFEGCESLTSLDVSSFNTAKVENMGYMFGGCESLKTIYCDDEWNPSWSYGMFNGCTALVGGKGTTYNDANPKDKTYARPDGLDDQPGYFTAKGAGSKEIYAALSGSTMTIYFDDQKASRSGVLDKWTPEEGMLNVPNATRETITKAVIDASMVNASPTRTFCWFYSLYNLTTIDGLANLNTSEVTDMAGMFGICSSLTSLNVSSFNTAKVENMSGMFTSSSSLTSLDVSNFNTGKVTDMSYMFQGCESLTTIYCDDAWNPSSSDDMFYDCTSLVGGNGTKYDDSKTDKTYARPDGLGGQPGYFTSTTTLTPEELLEVYKVIELINAIGSPITLDSEAAIVAARTAYDALTTDQKALVTNLATLEAAEKAYADLKAQAEADQAAANVVIGQINAIGDVTLESEPAIVAARSAYDALTDAQKALVTNYATLSAAEAKLDQLKKQAAADQAAADLVIGKINAIGTVSYTTASKALIDAARGAYDALTDAQKALVINYATLTAAEKAYADLKAQAEADQAAANVVINQIDAIGEVTLASEPAIVAARGAYDALTDAQKALVTNYATLTAAEAKLEILKKQAESDVAAAAAVTDLINGIGAISYTTESKALIDAAREAYNALTDAQKALVPNYATLVAAEQVYEQLKAEAEADQKAANVVIDLIDQIGEVTLASEDAINAARTAYNSLTSVQQELVTNYGTLLAAETTLELLKQQATIDQAMADDVIARIEAIGEVTYTNNCYSRIFYARAAYDALSDVQKALVTNYATLTAAEARYAELEAQAKAVEEAKTQLKALVSEAAELKAVAMLYSPASVEQIDAIIANAQQTINDPNATVEDVNAKTEIIRGEIQFVGAALLEEAKEQLRQSIKALYQSGDYPSWYAAVIIPALNQVDEIMWDNDKTVQENILFFQTTGKAIYDTAKAALEALRTSDTREIVSSCEFTGFTDAITVGMMWNEAALNTLVANLNASAATQPYHFNAEECMLTKWDAEYELFVGVDHNEGVVLTPGDYQFVANISIDGDDAAKFRFPKASEATLSVTVDAAVWSVDLAGIVIDATYSSAYTASPTFTLSEGQGIDETQDAQRKTQKIYHNGHFYILRGEHIYDLQGTLVR